MSDYVYGEVTFGDEQDDDSEISTDYFNFFNVIEGKTIESLEFSSEGYCFNKGEE